jgi:hypothetical protein
MAKTILERANRVLQYANYLAKKTGNQSVMNRIEYVEIYTNGYAEPGYKDPESGVIVIGNWNPARDRFGELISELPVFLRKAFERLDCDIQWDDQWSACYGCNKLVRIHPDCYTWKISAAVVNECEFYCHECIKDDPEQYVEEHLNNPKKCLTISVDLEALGFTRMDFDGEWHFGGHDKTPTEVAKGISGDFVFVQDSAHQFGMDYSVWVREPKEEGSQ